MRKTVVVAGATGYLGGEVVRALHDAGHRVRALARTEKGLERIRDRCDEIFIGEATRRSTLRGLCDGADVVFSSLGTRSLRGSPTIWDVDYRANDNLLQEARSISPAPHFVFVAAIHGAETRRLAPQMEARERIVDELVWHGPAYTILRPTGFFNDMAELFRMAKSGTVWLSGRGGSRINPIDGADLAREVVRVIDDPRSRGAQIDVGGPETFTFEQAAELALRTAGRHGKIRHVPTWTLHSLGRVVEKVNVNLGNLMQLMAVMGDIDFVGTPVGEHRLGEFYSQLASEKANVEEFLWAR